MFFCEFLDVTAFEKTIEVLQPFAFTDQGVLNLIVTPSQVQFSIINTDTAFCSYVCFEAEKNFKQYKFDCNESSLKISVLFSEVQLHNFRTSVYDDCKLTLQIDDCLEIFRAFPDGASHLSKIPLVENCDVFELQNIQYDFDLDISISNNLLATCIRNCTFSSKKSEPSSVIFSCSGNNNAVALYLNYTYRSSKSELKLERFAKGNDFFEIASKKDCRFEIKSSALKQLERSIKYLGNRFSIQYMNNYVVISTMFT